MKKLFSFATFALFAATMLITSCKKEEDGNVFRLKIQPFESNDKTSLGEGGVTNWVQGDAIFVNGITRKTQAIQVQVNNGNATADVDIDPTGDGRYYFFYPGLGTYATTNSENSTTKFVFNYNINSTSAQNGFVYASSTLKAPMAGVSNGQSVVFSNVFSMLKLVFPYEIGKTAGGNNHIITITSESTPISGLFSVEYTENNGWEANYVTTNATATANSKIYKVQIADNVREVYLPIPAGQHKLTIQGNYFRREMRSAQNFEKNKIYTIDFSTMPKTFSLNGRKVLFASSNLQYQASSGEYRFATNPWDYIGSGNTSSDNTQWKDLFFRDNYSATTSQYNSVPSISSNSVQLNDVEWMIPSPAEWTYLLSPNASDTRRYNCNILFQRSNITINNEEKKGIVLLPDNIVMPAGIRWTGWNLNGGYYALDYASWGKLEAAGAIFLPAAGHIQFNKNNNSGYHTNTGAYGRYASTVKSKDLVFTGSTSSSSLTINPQTSGASDAYEFAESIRLYRVVSTNSK